VAREPRACMPFSMRVLDSEIVLLTSEHYFVEMNDVPKTSLHRCSLCIFFFLSSKGNRSLWPKWVFC
jgi:hypothetical protein